MAKHAVLGPSSADRWMTCPGSVAISAGIKDPSNDAADEGTCAHFLASECLTLGVNADTFLGHELVVLVNEDAGFGPYNANSPKLRYGTVVDAAFAENLQKYLDYVRTLGYNNRMFVEVPVPISHLTGEEDAEGTADCIVINAEQHELAITDLKFGYQEVSPDNNPQMMMYALGAIAKFPEETASLHNIRLTICQPRAGDGKPKEWTCSRTHLDEFATKVKRASNTVWSTIHIYNEVKDSGNANALEAWGENSLLVTTKGCQWCKAKARCPRIEKVVADVTTADFEDLTQTELPVEIMTLPNADPNQDLANKMLKCDLIEGWIKAVRAEVERELVDGHPVPHFKLVQGRKGNRQWTAPADVAALLKRMRLKVEEIYDMSLKSPTDITGYLKKEPKRLAKLTPLIAQSEGKISVAHESDKRDAVNLAPTTSGMEAEIDVSDLV